MKKWLQVFGVGVVGGVGFEVAAYVGSQYAFSGFLYGTGPELWKLMLAGVGLWAAGVGPGLMMLGKMAGLKMSKKMWGVTIGSSLVVTVLSVWVFLMLAADVQTAWSRNDWMEALLFVPALVSGAAVYAGGKKLSWKSLMVGAFLGLAAGVLLMLVAPGVFWLPIVWGATWLGLEMGSVIKLENRGGV